MRQKYEVRLWQMFGVSVAITVTWAVGIAGAARYVSDQRRDAAADLATAVYIGEVARYENARDELTRCEQRVESRTQLRDVFLSIFALIEEQAGTETDFTVRATTLLDDDYPPIDPATCPPIPEPPISPEG